MADSKLPYVTGYGNITKALDGIRRAATPDRFTQDFLASKLGLKGGTPKPVIPFLKRTGFLASDGSPTDRYKQFRNDSSKGMAAAEALREGFNPLFQIDENVHKATDDELCLPAGLDENGSASFAEDASACLRADAKRRRP